MTKITVDSVWKTHDSSQPIERRLIFPFAKRRGELVLSITPGQPIPDLAAMSETMVSAATIDAKGLKNKQTITAQLVFSSITAAAESGLVAVTHAHRALPVLQLTMRQPTQASKLTYESQMKLAENAMPPAVLAAGDHAVGWLVRSDVIYFYPLVAVNIPTEVESYKEGSGSTEDLVALLPFQS